MIRVRQSGFTLVELMIGMAISLIIMAGAVYVFVNISQATLYQIRTSQALTHARDVMQLMARDIRRAGYEGHGLRMSTTASSNSFDSDDLDMDSDEDTNEPTAIRISAGEGAMTTGCILYTYNEDDSITSPSVADISYGFKYASDGQIWTSSSMSGSDCVSSGAWSVLTDADLLEVTDLSFELTSGATSTADSTSVTMKQVEITLTGKAKDVGGEQGTTFTLKETTFLPNLRVN